MSAIFGILRWDDRRCVGQDLARLDAGSSCWGRQESGAWQSERAGLGCRLRADTPEGLHERQPVALANGDISISAARLDNREELMDALKVPLAERASLSDGALLGRCYEHWAEGCAERLIGDWAFAVYSPGAHRLLLARDPIGQCPIHYHAGPRWFAFASDKKALLALDASLATVDELFVAQLLLSWPVYHGDRTAFAPIRRLPPAHLLTVQSGLASARQYALQEDFHEVPYKSIEECSEAFLPVFDEAVRCRLRSSGRVAATLSGGLDSSSVAVTAARHLAAQGRALLAYTSVPIFDTSSSVSSDRFGDEQSLAELAARAAPGIQHLPLRSEAISVLEAIDRSVCIHASPLHASANAYWMTDIHAAAAAEGAAVVLTGQLGNATISWKGMPRSLPGKTFREYITAKKGWLKRAGYGIMPQSVLGPLLALRLRLGKPWRGNTALNDRLASRLDIVRASVGDALHPMWAPWHHPLEARLGMLRLGRSILGDLFAEDGAAHGLSIRDPTADIRVVRFCLGVPDHLFFDRETGLDRLLIRTAMLGRLPDAVRMNRLRGRQAADLCARLRREATAVEAHLRAIHLSPALRHYLDLSAIQQAWRLVQSVDSPRSYRDAVCILTRGLSASRFIARSLEPEGFGALPCLDGERRR
ncbi:MAG: asparagine synthase [Candidatus Schekmanbacteria bacterium]|nr:asparagine synthase [Candidatus Schekmanbacteria bacterium]